MAYHLVVHGSGRVARDRVVGVARVVAVGEPVGAERLGRRRDGQRDDRAGGGLGGRARRARPARTARALACADALACGRGRCARLGGRTRLGRGARRLRLRRWWRPCSGGASRREPDARAAARPATMAATATAAALPAHRPTPRGARPGRGSGVRWAAARGLPAGSLAGAGMIAVAVPGAGRPRPEVVARGHQVTRHARQVVPRLGRAWRLRRGRRHSAGVRTAAGPAEARAGTVERGRRARGRAGAAAPPRAGRSAVASGSAGRRAAATAGRSNAVGGVGRGGTRSPWRPAGRAVRALVLPLARSWSYSRISGCASMPTAPAMARTYPRTYRSPPQAS